MMNVTIYLSAVKLFLFELLMEPKEILYQVNLTSVISSLQKIMLIHQTLNVQCDEINLSSSKKTNTQTINSTSLRVAQDSAAAWISLSLQVQLLSWTPCSSVLQGGRSLLPQQRGNGGGGSARILHHQLLPIPGHWTVESGPSSCVSSQLPGHTCTQALPRQSIYTLTIPSCPAQSLSCWLWTDSCFFNNEGKNTAFFCFKGVKAICSIILDRNALFFHVVFDCFFLTYHF